MVHGVCHFEIPADDEEKLVEFYTQLFGWKFTKLEGGMDYWMIDTGAEPGGGLMRRMAPEQQILNYVCVESVDEYAARARDLGAQVVVEKTAVGNYGFFAVLVDPQGNAIALWEAGPESPG